MTKIVSDATSVSDSDPKAPGDGLVDEPLGGSPGPVPHLKAKVIPLWNNTITISGLLLAIFAMFLLLSFSLFSIVSRTSNPYVDVIGYLVLPILLMMGLGVMPFGILFKSWRLRRKNPDQSLAFRFPRVDLNDPMQRRVAKYLTMGTFVFLPVVAVSSYHGYHYTDSSDFCGQACHSVMEPEATTYKYSSHARVSCAECHIGEGAGWFVKAKLSGLRQVLATFRESYSRPIAPAIRHLRPARETCEHCHWPQKFFGAQLKKLVHFASDEENTRREVSMLLNIGGGDESTGRAEGIHLHMALEGRVEYVATDDRLQDIPWVRFIDDAGRELVYRSDGRPKSDPKPAGQVRQLDCMDCHNRPAHKFRSPQESVNIYLEVGRIDTTLPFIKREAVRALATSYQDTETAEQEIGLAIIEFYQQNYPEVWETRKASVNQAVDRVREIYARNHFPHMKVDWQTYPDSIGHFISPGCFRCHDGLHVNQFGTPISHNCNLCHTFLNPLPKNGESGFIKEGEFIHPYELTGVHASLRCDQCHTGGNLPRPTCAACHIETTEFMGGTHAAFESFGIAADPMADSVDCESCHDLEEPMSKAVMNSACLDCHDDEEDRFDGMLANWSQEVGNLLDDASSVADEAGLALVSKLRKAGPLHNIAATRKILKAIAAQAEAADSLQGGEPEAH